MNGAQGRNRTTDTAIFSRMLYQLSYLGGHGRLGADGVRGRLYSQSRSSCPALFSHKLEEKGASFGEVSVVLVFVVFDRRNSVAAGEPAVEIDVGAALGTEHTELRDARLAADRTGSGN